MSKWKKIGTYIQEAMGVPARFGLSNSEKPMKGKKIVPGPLMKTFDKIDKNKDALIQLYKADIPFVSQMAVSRLISKHNMKGKDINKLREDAPTNSVASGGVDMNPTGLSKKKRELDARTKEYKIHARKLVAQREKRLKKKEMIKGSFVKELNCLVIGELDVFNTIKHTTDELTHYYIKTYEWAIEKSEYTFTLSELDTFALPYTIVKSPVPSFVDPNPSGDTFNNLTERNYSSSDTVIVSKEFAIDINQDDTNNYI